MAFAKLLLLPLDRVVAYPEEVWGPVTALADLVLPCMPFIALIHKFINEESVLILGDGSLSYVVATSLHYLYPDLKITVVGRNSDKLQCLISFIANFDQRVDRRS